MSSQLSHSQQGRRTFGFSTAAGNRAVTEVDRSYKAKLFQVNCPKECCHRRRNRRQERNKKAEHTEGERKLISPTERESFLAQNWPRGRISFSFFSFFFSLPEKVFLLPFFPFFLLLELLHQTLLLCASLLRAQDKIKPAERGTFSLVRPMAQLI